MPRMTADHSDETFWNLVAAYIDADDQEELRAACDARLFERVVAHVDTCAVCKALRERAEMARRNRQPDQDS
jgi:hypothetical protein